MGKSFKPKKRTRVVLVVIISFLNINKVESFLPKCSNHCLTCCFIAFRYTDTKRLEEVDFGVKMPAILLSNQKTVEMLRLFLVK